MSNTNERIIEWDKNPDGTIANEGTIKRVDIHRHLVTWEAYDALQRERDSLLAALRDLVDCPDYRSINTHEMTRARAAIRAAEKGAQ